MRWGGRISVLIAATVIASSAHATPCGPLPVPCMYEGLPFSVTIIDAETRAPLPDVHVLAEWVMWGHGGRNGPLIVQDAVTNSAGIATFPKWGPIRGYAAGLVEGYDPVVSFFKPGYEVAIVENRVPPLRDADERVRRFNQDGEVFVMSRFRGTAQSWTEELRAAPRRSTRISEDSLRQFRVPYLNRLRRVYEEYLLLPDAMRDQALRQTLVEHDLRILEGR